MKYEKIKNYVLKGIVAVLAILSLLTLCFSLLRVDYGSVLHSENGFDFLAFKSYFIDGSYDWAVKVIGAFSILFLVCAIFAIVLTVINFLTMKKTNLYNITIIVIAMFNTAFYLIEGLVFKSVFIETWGIGAESMFIKTSCYIPFIICAILVFAYIIVAVAFNRVAQQNKPIKEQSNEIQIQEREEQPIQAQTQKNENIASSNQTKADYGDEESKIALVTKYKELLDNGVLSQEEFDTKKKQILGL